MPQGLNDSYSPTYLPEDEVPQDLTGCIVETPIGWTGEVMDKTRRLGDGRAVDFGRGDVGTRPEELLRQRVIRIPTQPQEN